MKMLRDGVANRGERSFRSVFVKRKLLIVSRLARSSTARVVATVTTVGGGAGRSVAAAGDGAEEARREAIDGGPLLG